MFKEDNVFNEMMEILGKHFNLKEHRVLDKVFSTPADLEVNIIFNFKFYQIKKQITKGHKGKDGNLYVLDTARVKRNCLFFNYI